VKLKDKKERKTVHVSKYFSVFLVPSIYFINDNVMKNIIMLYGHAVGEQVKLKDKKERKTHKNYL